MSDVLDGFQRKARDHARTPMQWDSTPNAGFTTGKPWMRINDDYTSWNVSNQVSEQDSVLNFWKKAIKLRKDYEVLVYGDFELLSPEHEQIFAYTRTLEGTTALVLLNFASSNVRYKLEGKELGNMKCALENYAGGPSEVGVEYEVSLRGYEGRVYVQSTA